MFYCLVYQPIVIFNSKQVRLSTIRMLVVTKYNIMICYRADSILELKYFLKAHACRKIYVEWLRCSWQLDSLRKIGSYIFYMYSIQFKFYSLVLTAYPFNRRSPKWNTTFLISQLRPAFILIDCLKSPRENLKGIIRIYWRNKDLYRHKIIKKKKTPTKISTFNYHICDFSTQRMSDM